MARFRLKDSDEYYLALSDQPKRFDADSPVTNVFFDESNGQVNAHLFSVILQFLSRNYITLYFVCRSITLQT